MATRMRQAFVVPPHPECISLTLISYDGSSTCGMFLPGSQTQGHKIFTQDKAALRDGYRDLEGKAPTTAFHLVTFNLVTFNHLTRSLLTNSFLLLLLLSNVWKERASLMNVTLDDIWIQQAPHDGLCKLPLGPSCLLLTDSYTGTLHKEKLRGRRQLGKRHRHKPSRQTSPAKAPYESQRDQHT